MPDTCYKNFSNFYQLLGESPITRNIIPQINLLTERYGGEYLDLAERILLVTEQLGWDAFECFSQYIYDYIREMTQYLKTGEYGHSDFDEIYKKIYGNKEVMEELYLPGLFLAYGFTTILYSKYRLYRNKFLTRLNKDSDGIEVGFGEGFYLWEMCNHIPGIHPKGFDISPSAIKIASKVLNKSEQLLVNKEKERENYTLQIGNIFNGLPISDASQDWGILAEVIEHIPNPELGLFEMSRVLKPGALFYVTTVKDSNHMDHITNFPSVEYVIDLIENTGFIVQEK
ncbi:MAG: class I SAM-dependent methyltransferase, partial [Planctomycetaceae bacterium]|nr:class I SAM-dependent methyltransferase [Planctomycetaceae bacterium]